MNLRNQPEADLSLSAENVAGFFSESSESSLVKDRIFETLYQLADLRIKSKKGFQNDDSSFSNGVLTTCEGLESFLVPAVEEVLPLSEFLNNYHEQAKLRVCLQQDIMELLDYWGNSQFPGDPYLDINTISRCLKTEYINNEKYAEPGCVESGAHACRVITHLLTLIYNRPEEQQFNKLVGTKLKGKSKEIFEALQNTMTFLVEAFQSPDDNDEGKDKKSYRAGWSWTNWEKLPPILFFTQSVIDAYAELDLYIIRPASMESIPCDPKVAEFYDANEELFSRLQECVDEARVWVQQDILPHVATKLGLYQDDQIAVKPLFEHQELFKSHEIILNYKSSLSEIDELSREGEPINPTILYNNLYALLVLFWTFGDWNEEGTGPDIPRKGQIERTLVQLIYNYRNIPIIQKILNNIPFVFYLPGGDYFDKSIAEKEKPSYYDSGFTTLLSRQLVLFGVYGVGDRNIIDPLIRNNYVDLLLNRHRVKASYSYLWSQNQIEIFSTFRAVQTLTFYYAYLDGYEYASRNRVARGGGAEATNYEQFFAGLIKQLHPNGQSMAHAQMEDAESEEERPQRPDSFRAYYLEKHESWPGGATDEQKLFFQAMEKLGTELLQTDVEKYPIKEIDGLLSRLEAIVEKPLNKEGALRVEDFKKLKTKALDLLEA